jgi:hypothetical protein
MADTVWSAEIAQLEAKIAAANEGENDTSEDLDDGE